MKSTKVLVTVQKIILVKQKMLRNGVMNTKIQVKLLNQLNLINFPDHKFDWKIHLTAPIKTKLRKILKLLIIAFKRSSLNEQFDFLEMV